MIKVFGSIEHATLHALTPEVAEGEGEGETCDIIPLSPVLGDVFQGKKVGLIRALSRFAKGGFQSWDSPSAINRLKNGAMMNIAKLKGRVLVRGWTR